MENSKYNELFNNDKAKAEAFDKIAEHYYNINFGSMSKSDFDLLMFSIYIDRILENDENNLDDYSEYTLSKDLGITQSRVSSLKVRKELIYPKGKFDWHNTLEKISKNAVYEHGKIKLHIPDRNLYLELKHAIEVSGGFVETQLNPNLLQIRPEYFLDLMIQVSEEKDKKKLEKSIKEKLKQKDTALHFLDKEPIGKELIGKAPNIIADMICDCVPLFGGVLKPILNNIADSIKNQFIQ